MNHIIHLNYLKNLIYLNDLNDVKYLIDRFKQNDLCLYNDLLT